MSRKRIRFDEGQWFAVPLRNGEYAVGLVVRGNNKTVCLGYFFGPRFEGLPGEKTTWEKNPDEATLITQFGALGIVNGSWPLIQSKRPFSRADWPIPKFGMEIPHSNGKAYVRQYEFDSSDHWVLIEESVVDAKEIIDIPGDSVMMGGFVEIQLTRILLDN